MKRKLKKKISKTKSKYSSKKIIRVKKKVCNPEKSKDSRLFDLLGEKVEIYFNKKLFHTGILGFDSIRQRYIIGLFIDPDYYFYNLEVTKIIKNRIYLQG